jgi:hypothetical protein
VSPIGQWFALARRKTINDVSEIMALIKCDECGRDVSDKAASCPNCGNPIVVPEAMVVDAPHKVSTQKTDAEWHSETMPRVKDVEKEDEIKSSNINQGLKRISVFASLAWGGYWFYLKISKGTLLGIRYYKDEYIYLGLFGLFCIWIGQFIIYWVVVGFTKDGKELELENENYKKIVSKQFKNVEENINSKGEMLLLIIVFGSILFLLLWDF